LLDTAVVHYLLGQPLLWRRGRWCPVVGRDQTVRLGCRVWGRARLRATGTACRVRARSDASWAAV